VRPHREVLPDPKYGSRLVAKFVNIMMIRGKKSTAERIMYDAMPSVEDRSKQEALKMFKTAIDNVKPAVEVKSRRVGGSTYQVPVKVRPDRRTSLAMRWDDRRGPPALRAQHGRQAGGRASWTPPTTAAWRSRSERTRTRWRRPTRRSRIIAGSGTFTRGGRWPGPPLRL
jgi:hypothetical protein